MIHRPATPSGRAGTLPSGSATTRAHITKRFDAGDSEPVFFGSHRRAQAVLVPIATWEKLLARAEDELDLDLAPQRLADRRPWLGEEEREAALASATERELLNASRRDTAGETSPLPAQHPPRCSR